MRSIAALSAGHCVNCVCLIVSKIVEAMAMKLSRVQFTVRLAMAIVAVVAIVVAFVLQQERSARQEAEFKEQLAIAKARAGGHERMRGFLGDMGIVIARGATEAEVLRVTGPFRSLPTGSAPTKIAGYYPVAPDGNVLNAVVTRRLAGQVLEPQNYVYVGADDLPDPEFGVRLKRGLESLDVLFSLRSGHLDVWAFQRDERGEVVRGNQDSICFGGDVLEQIVREAVVKCARGSSPDHPNHAKPAEG